MKKLVSAVCGVMLGILVAFSCGILFTENVANAESSQEASTRIVTIKKEQYEFYEVEELSYFVDGIQVQYSKSLFVGDGGNKYAYKVDYSGVAGDFGLITGDSPKTLYYNTEPFADVEGFGAYGIDTMSFLVDADSEFYCKLSPKNGRSNYFSGFSFSVKEGSPYQVDSTTIGENGIKFSGRYDDTLGCFTQTINIEHTFHYDMDGDNLWFKIMGVKSDMTIEVGYSVKVLGTTITGNGASFVTARQYFGYTDPVEIKFTSDNGYIIDKLDLYYGGVKVITFYGGMQTSGVNYFKNNATYDKTIAYGNFVLAYESDLEWEVSEPDDSNYVALNVKNDSSEDAKGINSFATKLTDKGELIIYSNYLSEWVKVDVSAQKYAQIDFEKTMEEDKKFSSEPFNKVIISTTDETDPDAIIYDATTGVIPTRIFVVGFESDYLYLQVDLKVGYNFTSAIDSLYIYGDSYINRFFAGGSLVVSALQENAVTLSINMMSGSGADAKLFTNSMTRIYISKDGVTSVDALKLYASQTATSGYATLRGIERGTAVQILIEISPYYMMDIEGTLYASQYLNFSYQVDENKTINITVSEICFEVPVSYESEEIGTLKIYFERVENVVAGDGSIAVSATYEARFKAKDGAEYDFISLTHPNKYGFNLVNFSVNYNGTRTNLLKLYNDGTFGVDASDQTLHSFLASVVFSIPTNGLEVEASFTSKLIDFYFDYNDIRYFGRVYYGTKDIFMRELVQVNERGMYFGGITTTINDVKYDILTIEELGAVLVDSGEFAGWYKYAISENFNIDNSLASYEIILSYTTYKVTFVFTTDSENYTTLEGAVRYNSEFSIEELNTAGLPRPVYGTGYNLIGWNLAVAGDSSNYIILTDESADAEYDYYNIFTYEWIENVRFIPVFSPGVAVVTIYDNSGNFMNSIKVHYDDDVELTIGGLIIDEEGNYYKNEKFGYDFLGFYDAKTAGNIVLIYNLNPEGYSMNSELTQYFKSVDGDLKWALQENLDLYGRFDAVNYSLNLSFTNYSSCHGTKSVSTNTGTITTLDTGKFYITDFFITDSLVISGFDPMVTAFIAKITVGVKNFEGSDANMREASFYAVCDRAGNVTITNVDGLFDETSNQLTLVVADFINEESGADTIVVNVEYLPITYIVSFTANLVSADGSVILSDKSDTVYYKLTAMTAYSAQVNNWERCDEDGNVYTGKGWWNLRTPTSGLDFTATSLNGISGLRFTSSNGKVYSFKGWRDIAKEVDIIDLAKLTDSYDFVSVFSDEYDVSVNYFIYNDITKAYSKHYTTGYFWSYNSDSKSYYIDNAVTANAYEIYLIGGDLYYIAGWAEGNISTFTLVGYVENMFDMNSSLTLTYQEEAYQLDLYAVYNGFGFSVSETTSSYEANVNLPNDPSGNRYEDSDVIWMAVNKTDFDNLSSTNYSDADKITSIYRYSEGMSSYSVGTGRTFSKSTEIGEDKYLFAVVVRKIDDVGYQIAYVAVRVI